MAQLWLTIWISVWHCHHWFSAIPILLVKRDPGPQFRALCQILCESVHKWQNYSHLTDFKMAAAAILDFCTVWILVVNLTVGPHSQPMFQIRWKRMQKWPSYGQKCDFQYGGRRHLGFCWIRVLRIKAVQGPCSRCLYQIWCKSVHKRQSYGRLMDFKMAAATILCLLPGSIFSIWSYLDSGWGCSCKISCLYVNIWLSY